MPILSLNSHNMPPTGTSSYSALGLSGTTSGLGANSSMVPPLGTSLTHHNLGLDASTLLGGPSGAGLTGLGGLGTGLTGTASLYGLGSGLGGLSGTSVGALGSSAYAPPYIDVGASSASYPFTSSALRSTKMKMLDEIDIPLTRYGNRSSPCSPIPTNTWGLDDFTDSMSASMLHQQNRLALGALDLESK